MSKNPVEIKPATTFADAISAEPALGAAVGQFKMKLSANGVQLGWLGQNGNGWAVLATDPKDALTLEQYPYSGKTYYRIKGTSKYMSVSNTSYVGFYMWISSTSFTRRGNHLVSDFNGQALSLYSTDNGYIYAWDRYTVLDIDFQSV